MRHYRISKIAIILSLFVIFSTTIFAQNENVSNKRAKYVFLFIGDGMGFSHVGITEAYLATKKGIIGSEPLTMTQFPVLGMATTYSYSNMITCSSASATALASGHKTNNNVVGVYPDSTNVKQITYKLKELGYKIGIMTSVTIDHATPAGFFAHSISRKEYFNIALQLPESGFDFFGGGGFEGAKDKKEPNAEKMIYDKLSRYNYSVAYGVDDYKVKRNQGAEKILLLQNKKDKKDDILPFVIGREEDDLTLKQVLESAIDFLYKPSDKGFFIMCEGGKIDWSAHNNDFAGVITETLDMDEAIKVAYNFYLQHPDETLIVVTADHETGGLALGRERGYKYDLSIVDEAIKKVDNKELSVENYMSSEVLDTLSQKARIGWTTKSHTGVYVPVFAVGVGSELFAGRINNTDIPLNIMKAMDAKAKYTDYYYKRVSMFESEAPIGKNDIVFLGNSLTEGGKWHTYYPAVNKTLAKKGGAVRNRGIVGDTYSGINDRLDEILKGKPAKVFLLTGVNDISHNLSSSQIAEGIISVVKRIKQESPKTKIYLQSLLPFNESFNRYKLLKGKGYMVTEINFLLKKEAKKEKVTFIDLYPLFLINGKSDLSLPIEKQVLNPSLTQDGLHINKEGYKIWSEAIEKYVK